MKEFITEVLQGDKLSKPTWKLDENLGNPSSRRSEQSAIKVQRSQAGPSTEVTSLIPSMTARVRFSASPNLRRYRIGRDRLGGSHGFRRGRGATGPHDSFRALSPHLSSI